MCFEQEREAKSPQAVTRVSNPISCKSPIQGSRQDPAPCRTVKTGVNPGSASPTRAVGRNPCHLQLDLPLKTSSKAAVPGAGGAVVFRGGSADFPGQPRLPWERSWGEQLRKGRWWDYINYFSGGKEKKGIKGVGVWWKTWEALKAAELGLQARIKECPFVPTHLPLRHDEPNFFWILADFACSKQFGRGGGPGENYSRQKVIALRRTGS